MRGLLSAFSADSRTETPASFRRDRHPRESRLNPHNEELPGACAANFMRLLRPLPRGGYPGDDYKGGLLFAKLDGAKRTQDFIAAARWLKARPDCTGQIAATGFCFGAGMSNALSVQLGGELAAAAPFYGGQAPAAEVPKIKAAILIHHGGLDKALCDAYPRRAELKKNKSLRRPIHPNSVHGFQ